MSGIVLMVTGKGGWSKVTQSGNGHSPSSIGVQINRKGDVVYLEVGKQAILPSKQEKTFVNKGLCALGFITKGYYPEKHTSVLAHDELGVTFEVVHNDVRIGESRRRSGGLLKRIA